MGAGVSVVRNSEFFQIFFHIFGYIGHIDDDYLWYKDISRELRLAHLRMQALTISSVPVLVCDLLGFEDDIQKIFDQGLTPLLLDSSPDDKACTYFSYQPDYVILEAKTMVVELSKGLPLVQTMEYARRYLVNAMKHGKTLVIRLDSSVPDFMGKFNDRVLAKIGFDVDAKEGAYFPLELFHGGGKLIRDETNGWPERLFREEDMKPHKNFSYCR